MRAVGPLVFQPNLESDAELFPAQVSCVPCAYRWRCWKSAVANLGTRPTLMVAVWWSPSVGFFRRSVWCRNGSDIPFAHSWEQAFDGPEALREQILRDIEQARCIVGVGVRITPITGHTRVFGLVGHPVRHSLSPAMYNALFAQFDIDAVIWPLMCPQMRQNVWPI